jgi:ABC-type uncharacterized transport system involved in gliding motility auxiliary subunit
MRLDARHRRWLRLQNAAFTVLVLAVVALAAWLSQRYVYSADWTAAGHNTLAPQSADAIELLDGPLEATAYIGPNPIQRNRLRELLERYRRAGAAVDLEFVNPETHPSLVRELGIRRGGELVLRHGGREQRLQQISEQSVTNALLRLARSSTRWVVFLQGHGERDPHGGANFDLQSFSQRLSERGMQVQTLDLTQTGAIPDNTDVLVIASPRSDYLPGEVELLRRYVRDGGHLLWLTEPESNTSTDGRLRALARDVGIEPRSGVVVDPLARMFGTESPDFAVGTDYGDHPVTAELSTAMLLPQAAPLATTDGQGWTHEPLVRTRGEAWSETGPIRGTVSLQPEQGDIAGPLTLAVAASRGAGQRIAMVGDGDFLANAHLGNGANLDFGMRLLNWLAGDDAQVEIAPAQPPGEGLNPSQTAIVVIAGGFLIALPLALVGTGALIGLRRRRR